MFLLLRRQTRFVIYGSQIFDSRKLPTVLVCKVKGKSRNFEANVCESLYSTFKSSFEPYAFYNKRFAFQRPTTDPRQRVPLRNITF